MVHQSSRAPVRQLAHVFLQAVSGRLAIDETGQGQCVACLHQGDEAANRSDLTRHQGIDRPADGATLRRQGLSRARQKRER